MRFKFLFLILVISLPLAAHAQLKLRLEFDSAAPREIFVSSGSPKAEPADALKTDQKAVDFQPKDFKSGDSLYVWDRANGSLAAKPIKDIQSVWLVKAEEFKLLGGLTVRVEHQGKPVAAAEVKASDGKNIQTQLLDPNAKGEVQFFGLNPGTIKFTVNYKSGRQDASISQSNDIPLKRTDPSKPIIVAIADDVAVVPEPTTTPAQAVPAANAKPVPPAEERKSEPSNGIGNFVIYLLAVAVAIAAGYFAIQFMKNNPKVMEEKLSKLGVQIPHPQAQGPDAPIPAMQAAPQPPQKIILDDAQPDLLGASAPSAVSGVSIQPKFVRDNGQIFFLAEGESTVGRDDALEVSLSGETTVSRRHAQVAREGDNLIVRDLGSTNGTFVNGVQVQGDTALRAGDTVQFGSVRFRFEK